jgi:poly(3-hydroxybutyrate) depolymerase
MIAIKNMITRITSGSIQGNLDNSTSTGVSTGTEAGTGQGTEININTDFSTCASGTYRLIKDSITVSGISSGGSMATQLHVAFSKTFSGVGIVTGPPYYCPGTGGTATALTTCMSSSGASINVNTMVSALAGYVSKGIADDTSNIANDKIYIYHGTADTTVTEGVAKKNEEFYKKFVTKTENFKTYYNLASAHGFVSFFIFYYKYFKF